MNAQIDLQQLSRRQDRTPAREPVRRVALTTLPDLAHDRSARGQPSVWQIVGDPRRVPLPVGTLRDHPAGQVAGALAARWPGVGFDLSLAR